MVSALSSIHCVLTYHFDDSTHATEDEDFDRELDEEEDEDEDGFSDEEDGAWCLCSACRKYQKHRPLVSFLY